jgi:hypothetical protein
MLADLEAWLSRQVHISHAALLLAFLKHRNKITETEAKARLSPRELSIIETFERPRSRRGNRTLRWVVISAALATGAWLTWQHWDSVRELIDGSNARGGVGYRGRPRRGLVVREEPRGDRAPHPR